ncbi:Gfo/Idh/MocA family oxidoreductase [Cellulomonas sp.]|uniref:Gfo/Idh/MocA family protein n=1 Tax=Cellulomonas sp. TaxID=40001 RepID=UPI002811D40A|nr:Gfo/Idh/MocA family oxidoreductase [Cellulomonas sp.]
MGVNEVARVAVVGVHGHGASHLRTVRGLAAAGRARLSAVVDPRPVAGTALTEAEAGAPGPLVPADARWYPDLEALLADAPPDVVVLATPIHTHLPLASAALRAGCDVLLEKPTVASLDEHAALLDVVRETGRRCQVGFQTFGSGAADELARLVASGELGEVTTVGAVGTWVRTRAYYARSAWAGRRVLDGVPVVDGVVTNPLAHAVATALRVAGATRVEDVTSVDVELFHAHPIEADDTSSVVVRTAGGPTVAAGLTVCAAERTPAVVVVRGTEGEATLRYEADELDVRTARGARTIRTGRRDLLTDLLDARLDPAARLRCDVADTGAFMAVLDAVRAAPDPRPVPEDLVTWVGEGADGHPVVADVEAWCDAVAERGEGFAAVGAPWAVPVATPAGA